MFKVNISNSSKNLSWSAKFPTEVEANEWLQKQIGKPHRLPVESVYEIINLSLDPEWIEKDIQEKRKKESPSLEEKIDALIASSRGDNSKLIEVIQKIEALEIKYPEPIKEGK